MKLYLSGGIAGIANFKTIFRDAQMTLEEVGYEVVNPCDLGTLGADHISVWAKNMRADLVGMMECDGLALLPDWQKSRGATVEAELGLKLEMPVMLVEDWVDLKQGEGLFA